MLDVEKHIRNLIPPSELKTINDLIGAPSAFALAFVPSDNVSSSDAEILISLNTPHHPSAELMRRMRADLPAAFPGTSFYFQNADIVNQVLNFGLSAPIDIQIQDANSARSYVVAQRLLQRIKMIPGIADAHLVQAFNFPGLQVNVDRLRAAQVGLTQKDISNNLLTSLSSSSGVTPSFFLNPVNNVNYTVSVQVPLAKVTSVSDLMTIPVSSGAHPAAGAGGLQNAVSPPGEPAARLSDIADIMPVMNVQSYSHYTIQPVVDVAANIDGRDLGDIATDVRKIIASVEKDLPGNTQIDLRGQAQTMDDSFALLAEGLVLAVFLVYALLVILFQSWIDPLIIMMAVPGALIGIAWMLALSGTTINVEIADGRDHVGRDFSVEFDSGGEFRKRYPCARESVSIRSSCRCRPYAPAADHHDRARHDHRHGADGAWLRRSGRTERPARPRGDRWSDDCHFGHPVPGTHRIHIAAQKNAHAASARSALPRRIQRGRACVRLLEKGRRVAGASRPSPLCC